MLLQPNEKVILICRRHWLAFVFAVLPIGFFAILILAVPFLANAFIPEFLSANENLIFLGIILALEVLWIVFFTVVADYYLDVWVVTDHRLVFIELHGLFSRVVSSVTLANIQDITVEIHGLLPTLLKFGEVEIQSAGAGQPFVFKQVPRPHEIKDTILKVREEFMQKD